MQDPAKTNTLHIKTPEGIAFTMPLAGPIPRFLAWAIDTACIGLLTTLINTLLSILAIIDSGLVMAFVILTYFLISQGYTITLEWYWRGQTLGKRLLHLRVIDAQGLHLRFSQVVLRNLLRFIDQLPLLYFTGGVTTLLNRQSQRLGDIAANTLVTRIPPLTPPDLTQILAGKYNSFRDHPHLQARLRQNTTPQETALATQALLRRDQLDPQARLHLFTQLAHHFRTKATFPQQATQGLTDEQHIRNALDTLLNTRAK